MRDRTRLKRKINDMLTKEEFMKYAAALEQMHAEHRKKDAAVQILCPMSTVWYDTGTELQLIFSLLGKLMECEWEGDDTYDNDIEWFWYEAYTADNKSLEASIDDKTYIISTFSDLYDFIVSSKNTVS